MGGQGSYGSEVGSLVTHLSSPTDPYPHSRVQDIEYYNSPPKEVPSGKLALALLHRLLEVLLDLDKAREAICCWSQHCLRTTAGEAERAKE
jgi:hypothetical protein